MKNSQATVTIKIEHIKKILESRKFEALQGEPLSIEKAHEANIFYVDSMNDLFVLGALLELLEELKQRDLDLVDSVTIPLEQLKFFEAILTC